ncbi:ferritin-like domain-containing protein [Gelidibacter mesophilus]|uniref:ferritin-like domain-containing protein n=1 Tax=Gelidibacter mesophilus TaxID=169050 RepID=UPI00041B9420|nr:PA2169 family four-helix-bundle protein [Gelidibacter mesophilus]
MSTRHDKLVDQLEEILEKNRDAEKGYKKAAENAKNPSLKTFFADRARDRASFNAQLKREMVVNYDDIDDEGSFTGTIHRAWMDVKALFSADNDESMLEEAIRGEKASVEEYEEVLKDSNLPASIATIVRQQKMKVQEDLAKVKSMEHFK